MGGCLSSDKTGKALAITGIVLDSMDEIMAQELNQQENNKISKGLEILNKTITVGSAVHATLANQTQHQLIVDILKEQFDKYDRNGDGKLDRQELTEAANNGLYNLLFQRFLNQEGIDYTNLETIFKSLNKVIRQVYSFSLMAQDLMSDDDTLKNTKLRERQRQQLRRIMIVKFREFLSKRLATIYLDTNNANLQNWIRMQDNSTLATEILQLFTTHGKNKFVLKPFHEHSFHLAIFQRHQQEQQAAFSAQQQPEQPQQQGDQKEEEEEKKEEKQADDQEIIQAMQVATQPTHKKTASLLNKEKRRLNKS